MTKPTFYYTLLTAQYKLFLLPMNNQKSNSCTLDLFLDTLEGILHHVYTEIGTYRSTDIFTYFGELILKISVMK